MQCKRCRSHAINHHLHGRDGSEPELCDVCFWRMRAEGSKLTSYALIFDDGGCDPSVYWCGSALGAISEFEGMGHNIEDIEKTHYSIVMDIEPKYLIQAARTANKTLETTQGDGQ